MNSSNIELDSDISRANESFKSGTMSSNLSRNDEAKPIERRTRCARKSLIGQH